MEPIKIYIVEDHQIFRVGLKLVLAEIPYVKVIGESGDGIDFLYEISKQMPDIVFMDIKMPKMDGLKATQEALQKYPGLKIIILSMFGEEDYVYQAIQLGVSGFILKNSDKLTIEKAIQQVSSGTPYFSGEIMSILVKSIHKNSQDSAQDVASEFSKREIEVLEMIGKGYSNKEIADKLFISHRTVEGHKSKLIQKTGQSNSLGLILWAMKNKLINVTL